MKELVTPKTISFLFVLILLCLLLEYQVRPTNFLGIFLQITGGFVATFVGVYSSMHYAKKQEEEKDIRDSNKSLLGSLQLLWSEMSLNRKTMDSIREGINTMPRNSSSLLNGWQFLLGHSTAIRSNVFYSVIGSGGMNEITKKDLLFKNIFEAYYNMDIIISAFKMTENIFQDYINENPKVTSAEDLWRQLDRISEKLQWTIESNDEARRLIIEYLRKNGINLSEAMASV